MKTKHVRITVKENVVFQVTGQKKKKNEEKFSSYEHKKNYCIRTTMLYIINLRKDLGKCGALFRN